MLSEKSGIFMKKCVFAQQRLGGNTGAAKAARKELNRLTCNKLVSKDVPNRAGYSEKETSFNLISHNHSECIFLLYFSTTTIFLSHCIVGLAGPVQWFPYITS